MCSEEDLMKMRLLIDGDGTGEDRRLNTLFKNILKWAGSDEADEDETAYERILTQISQCEWSVRKNSLFDAMNREELENYKNLVNQIEDGIVEAKNEIREAKIELSEARKIRKNKLEYDALAKVISEYPSRSESESKLFAIESELSQLRQTEFSLDNKLEMRKKQFHVLLHSINQLQDLLDEDDEEDLRGSSNPVESNDASELNTSNVSSTPERDVDMD